MRTKHPRTLAPLCTAAAMFLGVTLARAETFVVDFFPDGLQVDNIIQLRFLGPAEGRITGARLFIDFTTAQGFRSEDFVVQLVTPVLPDDPDGGFWFLTGEDLGWSGFGSFSANPTTNLLNGELRPGLWGFDVGSINDPPAYTGTFSSATRFEIDIEPIPEPATGALLMMGVVALSRRRRV